MSGPQLARVAKQRPSATIPLRSLLDLQDVLFGHDGAVKSCDSCLLDATSNVLTHLLLQPGIARNEIRKSVMKMDMCRHLHTH
eukprot:2725487-Amphidinium_carterae.1